MKNHIFTLTILASSVLVFVTTSCTETMPSGKQKLSANNPIDNRVYTSNPVNNSNYILRAVGGGVIVPNAPLPPGFDGLEPSHVRGGRIYDDFTIELGTAGPGTNPLAAIAGGSVGSGWLCSECHGFDYEGTTTFNGVDVNLHELIQVRGHSEETVIHLLYEGFEMVNNGALEMVHSYKGILSEQAIVDVADFVVNELYDTHEVLSAATGMALGDMAEGEMLYNYDLAPGAHGVPLFIRSDGTPFSCGMCHESGVAGIPTGAELKAAALADPFKFLHRANFGSPRDITGGNDFGYGVETVMPGLYEVILTDGLHFGSPHEASAAMNYIQMNK